MIARYAVVIAVILPPAGGLGAADDKKGDKEKLQGEWAVVSWEVAGRRVEEKDVKQLKPLVIKGDKWTAPLGLTVTFKIDPTKTPKEFDHFYENNGKVMTFRGIYKLEGDTLTVCRSMVADGERPKEFKTGTREYLYQLKRSGK